MRKMLAFAMMLAGPAAVAAQAPPASQLGSVSQTINRTVVSVEYHRPLARGRVLFGEDAVVIHDALWTPGANRATILELSTAARVAGHAVPAGRYSVWMIPGPQEWTVLLNRTWDTHHAIYPGPDDDVFRTTIRPERGAHIEALTFYFPVVGPYGATLRMHWGEWIVPITIEVEG